MADTLAAAAVVPLLRGRFGSPYLYAPSCESTQRLLGGDLPEGAVAVCEEQTAGRGRLGRAWEAPAATSILCSVLLRPPAGRPAELSLLGGLAAAATVERALARPCAVKWPNDVLVEARKVAGVLGELRGETVVLGIGLNVNQRAAELPAAPRTPAASLFALDGVYRPRAPLLADLVGELEERYARWLGEGLGAFAAELEARDFLRGRRVTVDGLRGVADGIAADGRLVLLTESSRRLVASGDVTVEG